MTPLFVIGIIVALVVVVGLFYFLYASNKCKIVYTEYVTNEYVKIPIAAKTCDGKATKNCNGTLVQVAPVKINGTFFKIDNVYQFANNVPPSYPTEYITYTNQNQLACMSSNPSTLRKISEFILKPHVPIKYHADMTPYSWNWAEQAPEKFYRYYLRGDSIMENKLLSNDTTIGKVSSYVPFYYSNSKPVSIENTSSNFRYARQLVTLDTDTKFPIPLEATFIEHAHRTDKLINFFIYRSLALSNNLGHRVIVVFDNKAYVIDIASSAYKERLTTKITAADSTSPLVAVAFVNGGFELGCFPFWMHVLTTANLDLLKTSVHLSQIVNLTKATNAEVVTEINAISVVEPTNFKFDNRLLPLMKSPDLTEPAAVTF